MALGGKGGIDKGSAKMRDLAEKGCELARYITFQLAEVAVPRDLFAAILKKIDYLCLLPETG